MTTRYERLSINYPGSVSPWVAWRRAGYTFLLTLLAIFVFGAAFAVGYSRVHEGRILPGVDVAGVSLAGLDRAAAEAELRQVLPSLSSGQLVIDVGSVRQTIGYSEFDRDYDVDFMLDQALGVGRGAHFVEQLTEQLRVLINGTSVSPVVTWDNDELARRVAEIALAAQSDPVNAAITRSAGRYSVSPAADGQSVDVEGALTSALQAVNNISPADTQVTVSTSVVPPQVSTEEAQAAAEMAERVVANDMNVAGAELSLALTADALRGWVHLDESAGGGDWRLVIEREPIAQAVENFALSTDIAPTNASFAFAGEAVAVVPSEDGRAVDVEATTNNIMAALEGRANSEPASDVNLALVPVAPTFSTADAQAIAPRVTKLSEWTTKYTPSPLNGEGVNITIPTSIIDGYVVEPGAEFDYLDVIGPITSPPYTAGAAIVHGRTVLDGVLGGGMCSSSTTIFNAAMRAGLEITSRANHAYYISRYPLGLDATVWISSASSRRTMSFVNDTEYPILIRGINRHGEVTFELYGVNDGRTVELTEPRIENAKEAIEQIEYTDDLAPGVMKRTEFNVDGMEVWVTRTVRDAGGNVIHQDEFYSKYRTIDGITQVGRYPNDPPAETIIPASEFRPSGPTTPAE